ncbi:hypothetical protein PF001_g9174 [Phytophthora fragariae]|uniref:Uncharacterized protein n=1 Tax=Phytophthora fragariae TaxID=53985 RepID=A0A6A4DQH3_9STRA|nr:hypothetical protein PF001_g9174 [Phytophthora fragariae]
MSGKRRKEPPADYAEVARTRQQAYAPVQADDEVPEAPPSPYRQPTQPTAPLPQQYQQQPPLPLTPQDQRGTHSHLSSKDSSGRNSLRPTCRTTTTWAQTTEQLSLCVTAVRQSKRDVRYELTVRHAASPTCWRAPTTSTRPSRRGCLRHCGQAKCPWIYTFVKSYFAGSATLIGLGGHSDCAVEKRRDALEHVLPSLQKFVANHQNATACFIVASSVMQLSGQPARQRVLMSDEGDELAGEAEDQEMFIQLVQDGQSLRRRSLTYSTSCKVVIDGGVRDESISTIKSSDSAGPLCVGRPAVGPNCARFRLLGPRYTNFSRPCASTPPVSPNAHNRCTQQPPLKNARHAGPSREGPRVNASHECNTVVAWTTLTQKASMGKCIGSSHQAVVISWSGQDRQHTNTLSLAKN